MGLDLTLRCASCNAPITDAIRSTRRYCSRECWRREYIALISDGHRAARSGRKCKACSAPVSDDLKADAEYCSTLCRNRFTYVAREEAARGESRSGRICLRCGGEIARSKKFGTKYCCEKCRSDASNQRNKPTKRTDPGQGLRNCAQGGDAQI